MKKQLFILISIVFALPESIVAQCAMCKTTIVNNVSNGELSLAEGLNYGILYLFTAPYLGIIVIGLFWYRYSRTTNKSGHESSDSDF